MNDLTTLLQNAQATGLISQASVQSLSAPDIGQVIRAGLGIAAEDFEASEVYGSIVDIDDSGSIRMAGNSQHMRDGVNLLRAELLASNAADDILHLMKTINGEMLYPFGPLGTAPLLDAKNYNPQKGTPLYDSMIASCGLMMAKWREFSKLGVQFRGSVLFVSDGADEHSRSTPADVKPVIEDLLRREIFIVMFMGIDDGRTDYRAVAKSVGIPDQWVLTPGSSGSEIRQAFAVASRASKTASQGAQSFSEVIGGGFGTIV